MSQVNHGNFKVSIVVPCYNQAQYLEECLESVINQTYKNWECIIVNDGSPDNTEEVALSICAKDSRITYLKKENGGLSSARNSGIKIAKGEFILPLDADDIIGGTYLEKAVDVFSGPGDLCVVYCEAKKFGIVNEHWDLPDYSFRGLLLNNCIFCSAIFKKSDWERCNGYDEHLKSGLEDWAFWLKLLTEKSLVYRIPEVLFFYRIKEVSMVKELYNSDFSEVYWYLFENNMEKYRMHFKSPILFYLEDNVQTKMNKQILDSTSYKIGNIIVRFLKIFKLK